MGTWLKHDVITVVNAPLENVWNTWSDLDSMSLWMSWIESVKTVDEETSTLPDLTEWTLAANGFRFKWKAKISERIETQKLKWESVGGLPTKGSVEFYTDENGNEIRIEFSDIIDEYDVLSIHDREVEVLGWDSDGNEYSAVGMESCGDLVEIYDDTIEPTENLN